MISNEFKGLKKGDVIYVRDFGSPGLIRKALFERDITSLGSGEPGTCIYIEADGSPKMYYVGKRHEASEIYFRLDESALTEDALKELLLERYKKQREYAIFDLERADEVLARIQNAT